MLLKHEKEAKLKQQMEELRLRQSNQIPNNYVSDNSAEVPNTPTPSHSNQSESTPDASDTTKFYISDSEIDNLSNVQPKHNTCFNAYVSFYTITKYVSLNIFIFFVLIKLIYIISLASIHRWLLD